MIKCIEDSKVASHTHLAHLFIIAMMSFYSHKLIQKALAEHLSSQCLKEYPHLFAKCRKTLTKTDENAT